jgi:hypothetical protein
MVRDITVYADDLRHLDRLIQAIHELPEVELLLASSGWVPPGSPCPRC